MQVFGCYPEANLLGSQPPRSGQARGDKTIWEWVCGSREQAYYHWVQSSQLPIIPDTSAWALIIRGAECIDVSANLRLPHSMLSMSNRVNEMNTSQPTWSYSLHSSNLSISLLVCVKQPIELKRVSDSKWSPTLKPLAFIEAWLLYRPLRKALTYAYSLSRQFWSFPSRVIQTSCGPWLQLLLAATGSLRSNHYRQLYNPT